MTKNAPMTNIRGGLASSLLRNNKVLGADWRSEGASRLECAMEHLRDGSVTKKMQIVEERQAVASDR
jgi:hypothetical protein